MNPGDATRRELGSRLRELRLMRGLTTRKLAQSAGVSPSMVSQVETGKTGVSVGSLRRMAGALGVPLASFFVEQENAAPPLSPGPAVVRAGRRPRLTLPESRIGYELLTPDLRWDIEFVRIELEPDHPPVESMSHPGQECALVLEGTMHVIVGETEHELGPGDSIVFDSTVPHRIENRGAETVVQISAITPPSF